MSVQGCSWDCGREARWVWWRGDVERKVMQRNSKTPVESVWYVCDEHRVPWREWLPIGTPRPAVEVAAQAHEVSALRGRAMKRVRQAVEVAALVVALVAVWVAGLVGREGEYPWEGEE